MSKSDIQLYGLAESRCDTMKRAGNWLRSHGCEFSLHDFKKEPPTEQQLRTWLKQTGWETLVNRRGTTWRKVDQAIRDSIDEASALQLMLETPSIIKRPVLVTGAHIEVGFDAQRYEGLLS